MKEISLENIPAYQRKRSISAKERSLEKNKFNPAEMKPAKKTRRRYARSRPEEEQVIIDIPAREIFPQPDVMETLISPSKRAAGIEEMKICGTCDGYFEKIEVAVIKLTRPLREGDEILMETADGLFKQTVTSLQIDRNPVRLARSGSDIGLKVLVEPKVGGTVYKII